MKTDQVQDAAAAAASAPLPLVPRPFYIHTSLKVCLWKSVSISLFVFGKTMRESWHTMYINICWVYNALWEEFSSGLFPWTTTTTRMQMFNGHACLHVGLVSSLGHLPIIIIMNQYDILSTSSHRHRWSWCSSTWHSLIYIHRKGRRAEGRPLRSWCSGEENIKYLSTIRNAAKKKLDDFYQVSWFVVNILEFHS